MALREEAEAGNGRPTSEVFGSALSDDEPFHSGGPLTAPGTV